MSDHPETQFERLARERFDASVDALDAYTQSRLNRARQAAVAEVETRNGKRVRAWAPAVALAATAAVALVLWRYPGGGTAPDEIAASAAIAELPVSDEDLELVSEDPEFYAWSAQQASAVTNGTG